MKWKRAKISEVCQGIYDGPHATPSVSEEGAVFLGISNITPDGHLDLSSPKHIGEMDLPKWTKRVTPQEGDIVFSYEATLNLYAIIPKGFRGCLGRRMALIRPDEEKVLGKFLYYYFFSDEWRGMIAENTVIGATVDRIPLIRFPNFPVSFPPVEKQRLIMSVLSAYDDLIENNQKQIKLLEEAAQRLYKEWFVDLRFPGHETTPIVDGVPEGWTWGTLADIAVFRRGKTITKDQVKAGIIPVVAGGLEPAYYHDTPNTNVPVVTVSGSGANAGFTRMYHTKVWASDCSYIDAAVTKNTAWVYCFLKGNKASIDAMQKGAAQPHVYAKDLNAMKALFPADKLMEQFRVIADPMFTRIGKLDMQIKRLAEARDRLLPKLMSGEIEV